MAVCGAAALLIFGFFQTRNAETDVFPEFAPPIIEVQTLATAFNRMHMQNEEGGIVEEEFRVAYRLSATVRVEPATAKEAYAEFSALAGERDYMELAQALSAAGLNIEAKATLDQGVAAEEPGEPVAQPRPEGGGQGRGLPRPAYPRDRDLSGGLLPALDPAPVRHLLHLHPPAESRLRARQHGPAGGGGRRRR